MGNQQIMKTFKCPHCKSTKETWFDRCISIREDGSEHMATRCEECGMDIDEPVRKVKKVKLNSNPTVNKIIEFIKSQKPLDSEAQKILHENLWDLYR